MTLSTNTPAPGTIPAEVSPFVGIPALSSQNSAADNDALLQAALSSYKEVWVKPGLGTVSMSAQITFADADQRLIVDKGTALDWGTNTPTSCFKIPNGLSSIRQYTVEGGGKLFGRNGGTNSTIDQTFCEFADSNGYGWLTMLGMILGGYDVDPSKQFLNMFRITAYDLTFYNLITIHLKECDIPAPVRAAAVTQQTDVGAPQLLITPNVAGSFLGPVLLKCDNTRLGGYTGANPHRWYFNADADIVYDHSNIFMGAGCKWNGTGWSGSYVKTSESAAHTPGVYTTYGSGWTDHVGIVNCDLNEGSGGGGSIINWENGATAYDGMYETILDSLFIGVKVKALAKFSIIKGCDFDGQVTGSGDMQTTLLELAGDNSIVQGNLFRRSTTNLLHLNGNSRCVINGNSFKPNSTEKTIRETSPGDNNAIAANNGTALGGGLALSGAATIAFESGKNLS